MREESVVQLTAIKSELPQHIHTDCTLMESDGMKTNVGNVDRIIRIILGLVLIALVFVGPQTPWGWIGVIPLATGLLSSCPLYSLLGLSTCPTKKG
ncbi:YgaP family membrane protein [Porticoccus sp.]